MSTTYRRRQWDTESLSNLVIKESVVTDAPIIDLGRSLLAGTPVLSPYTDQPGSGPRARSPLGGPGSPRAVPDPPSGGQNATSPVRSGHSQ